MFDPSGQARHKMKFECPPWEGGLNFKCQYDSGQDIFSKTHDKGRTIRLQGGGGDQEVWVRTIFFFLQPGKESFFIFST